LQPAPTIVLSQTSDGTHDPSAKRATLISFFFFFLLLVHYMNSRCHALLFMQDMNYIYNKKIKKISKKIISKKL
jgi:hypothetical protein